MRVSQQAPCSSHRGLQLCRPLSSVRWRSRFVTPHLQPTSGSPLRLHHLPPVVRPAATAALVAERLVQEAASDVAAPTPYPWTRHWWPVIPTESLHDDRPNSATVLGIKLVLWKSPDGWSALQDRCPHRLAPLSEGRVDAASGTLMCSYHGWRFDGGGACKSIPQATDDKAGVAATSSRRSCVTSYPVKVVTGLLFVWLDVSPNGLAEAAVTEPYVAPEMNAPGALAWQFNEVPGDFARFVEQGMDPTHAMFLHVGSGGGGGGFKMDNAVAMAAEKVPEVDLHQGYTWRHRGYEKKNEQMRAERKFIPPASIRVEYLMPNGVKTVFCTMTTPVEPGLCRTFFAFVINPPPPGEPGTPTAGENGAAAPAAAAGSLAAAAFGVSNAPTEPFAIPAGNNGAAVSSNGKGLPDSSASSSATSAGGTRGTQQGAIKGGRSSSGGGGGGGLGALVVKLLFSLPHYFTLDQHFVDQDVVMLHKQDVETRSRGLSATSFALVTPSDQGVLGINKWLKAANYGSMWAQVHAPEKPPLGIVQELPLDAIMDRQTRHVQFCKVCQKGLRDVTALCAALATACLGCVWQAASALLGAQTVLCLAALPWAVVAVGLGLALRRVLAFRQDRFISGAGRWRATGGYAARRL